MTRWSAFAGRVTIRTVLALPVTVVWAIPGASMASWGPTLPKGFACSATEDCYMSIQGTISVKVAQDWTLKSTDDTKVVQSSEALTIQPHGEDGKNATFTDDYHNSSRDTYTDGGCKMYKEDGKGSGKEQFYLVLPSGFSSGEKGREVPWSDPSELYKIVFAFTGPFPTTISHGDCKEPDHESGAKFPYGDWVSNPVGKLANPLILKGKMIRILPPAPGTKGNGTATMVWNLTVHFSSLASLT
jgi:hypothetical protein